MTVLRLPSLFLVVCICAGCGTVHVSSSPPGATAYQVSDTGKATPKGTTPCEYHHGVLAQERAYVVWPDGTRSPRKAHLRAFFLFPETIEFHFAKPPSERQ